MTKEQTAEFARLKALHYHDDELFRRALRLLEQVVADYQLSLMENERLREQIADDARAQP